MVRRKRAEMDIISLLIPVPKALGTRRQFLDPLAAGPYEKLKPLEYHIHSGRFGDSGDGGDI